MKHAERTVSVAAAPDELFAYLDDPHRLSSHMERKSWAMAGTSMTLDTDALGGKAVGSRITMSGRLMGLELALDEVIEARDAPFRKSWATIGSPRLLVIGPYRMGFSIAPDEGGSRLTVSIDYEPVPSLLLRPAGAWYASWCVRRMAMDAAVHFA